MDKPDKKRTGRYGEEAAKGYLAAKGYKILTQNYKAALGEVDIIAQDSEYLVFAEVKYRKQTAFGTPAEGIPRAKQKALISAAEHYLAKNNLYDASCRFDVVEVFGREMLEINHIEDAFWVN